MPKKLGFGVLGLGMGVNHCLAIEKAKGAQLVAACDTDSERLDATVKKHGCKGYDNFDDMLADPEIDVINIVTETGYHGALGARAARAGKHIIMEKPIEVTQEKVRAFEAVITETGVKCGCIFQSRVADCNIKLKKAIEKGKMGRIFGMHGNLPWYRGPQYFSGPHGPWRGTWALDGGGSMMNQGIHTVDLLLFLCGRVTEVCGFYGLHDHDLESEDQVVACLKFANGALGSLYTTTCANPESGQEIYGFGSYGSFRKKGDALIAFDMGGPKEREKMLADFGVNEGSEGASKDPMAVLIDGHCRIIEDLVKAVHQDRDPIIPIAEAQHAVEVICAIYQAARERRTVTIEKMRG